MLVQQLEPQAGLDHRRDDVAERVLPLLGAVVDGLRRQVRVGAAGPSNTNGSRWK